MTQFTRWSDAMERALYGPGGFYRREVPYYHFSTSAQAPVFAEAIARLAEQVDVALGRPATFDVVDVGAGNGELLGHLAAMLDDRVRLVAVERRPRPSDLPDRVRWETKIPQVVTGLLIACELLDNVPCDVAVVDTSGELRYEEVDETGATRPGAPVGDADAKWLAQWWPLSVPGQRAEIGLSREAMWRKLTGRLAAGTALAIDYGHERSNRPPAGSMAGFLNGRQVRPVPDGTCDITAHVAVDAIPCERTQRQREALKALGLPIERPQLAQAYRDPTGYAMDLARASAAGRLTDPTGLGAHWWMLHSTWRRRSG
ncbi:SAM-dependent methyltransferase [Glycomyces sp. L485]|uniref:SAM-dependent methyltransferase n=1 Tax=Glycomyces sp. L485 TaxID=2909235 RepID=UPI001F4B7A4B|nr:SAM-dependent methyltransferase [Glycomyces sp. L485]MCH7229290.1 SAM-dependent methyltransferase [Glycomyces sp. L485]